MKFIVAQKTKKYIVLMEKETSFGNSKNTVTGLIQCPYRRNTLSREDSFNQESFYKTKSPKSKRPLNFTIRPSNTMDKD